MIIPRISQANFNKMLQEPGKHSLGGGLMLLVRAPGKASYSMRYQRAGKRRELGLGAAPAVTLGMAREQLLANQRLIVDGKDPAETSEKPSKTFDEAVNAYLVAHAAALGPKALTAWRGTLGTYASPRIGRMDVGTVTVDDVLGVLQGIWHTKTPTATKLQRRMAKIFAFARARGWTNGAENPARWVDLLQMTLPKPSAIHRERNQAAVPFEQLPKVIRKLEADDGAAALCVRWIALTACRATAGSHARWREIDRAAKVWKIPAEKMKGHPALRVALSTQALAVLDLAARRRTTSDFVFPGQRDGKPLSLTALVKSLRRAGAGDATTHGLRSGFKSFTIEREMSRELAEMALGHHVGSDVERAYRGSDALEPRRKLMQAWGDFLSRSRR